MNESDYELRYTADAAKVLSPEEWERESAALDPRRWLALKGYCPDSRSVPGTVAPARGLAEGPKWRSVPLRPDNVTADELS